MLLLVDAGNTRIKWALVDSHVSDPDFLDYPSLQGSVERSQAQLLEQVWAGASFSNALLSNVAGAELRECLERIIFRVAGVVPLEWFSSVAELAGVSNGYRDPSQLGCDRFAALIGAHARFPGQDLIVATCGTATTVDGLSAEGRFFGGVILPGLEMMALALAEKTAQLPKVIPIAGITTLADNTNDAIAGGCIAAQAGAIEYFFVRQRRLNRDVLCLLGGGAAKIVAPFLCIPYRIVDNLVLAGLHAVAIHRDRRDQNC